MRDGEMKSQWAGVVCLLLLAAGVGATSFAAEPAPSASQPAPPEHKAPIITGVVASAATGVPLAGARIEIFSQLDPDAARQQRGSGDPLGEPLAWGAADPAGRFRIVLPHLSPTTRILIVAQAPGHARSRFPRPLVMPEDLAERDAGRAELPAGRRLNGKVLDAAGRPVSGARVVAMVPRSRARQAGAGASFTRSLAGLITAPPFPVTGKTEADGSFALEGLPLRPVSLRVYADGLAPGLMENIRAAGAGAGITVRLSQGHALAGKVVAPDGKTPVAGAWVMAGDEGWDGIARSGSDGTFRLERLRPGSTSINATVATVIIPSTAGASLPVTSGYAPSSDSRLVLPLAAQAATPTLRLRPGGIVHAKAIDRETRHPISGAFLTLEAPGETDLRMATTASKGELLFTGVPAGSLRLRAEAEDHLEEELGPAPLVAGQTREWSAALRPACAIEGTVRDSSGRPVTGATVSVAGPLPFTPSRVPIFFGIGVEPVETDAQGRFALERLPSRDELKVSVESSGFAPWEMSGIKLRPGERRSGLEVLLEAGLMISGRVVDGSGQPVAAAGVTASRRREGGPGGMVIRFDGGGRGGRRPGRPELPGMSEELPPALSGPDGVFRLRGARPGIWSVEIRAQGFAPKSTAGLKLAESAKLLDAGDIVLAPGARLRGRIITGAGEPVPFARGALRKEFTPLSEFTSGTDGTFVTEDLAPGDNVTLTVDADGFAAVEKAGLTPPIEDLVITMSSSSRVLGQVLDRETRRPIPDFAIAISRSRTGGSAGMMMDMAIMGPETSFHAEDGAFEIRDVDPGKVAIAARAPGYRESALRDLEVPDGKDLKGLVFTLERSAWISGTVLDDRGRPLPGATVQKKEASGGMGLALRLGGASAGFTLTDGDGNFTLTGLDRGPMTLAFSHPDYELTEMDVDTGTDIERLRVTLTRGATLSGIVLHEEDGSPVARATVTASAAGAERFANTHAATTGPDGTFALEAVAAGRYRLRAEAIGLSPAIVEDVVVAGGSSPPPFEMRMGGGVTLVGRITGAKEAELPQFTVRALSPGSGGFGTTAAADASGKFEMKGLSPGSVTLLAGSGLFGGRSTTRTVQIPEGTASFETTIEFPRGNTVEGAVTRGGQPVDGASIIFMHTSSRTSVTATSSSSGHYLAEDLDDGEYSVSVMQLTSGLSHSTKVSVEADRQFDIELPLFRITGTVTEASSGQPLDGATVSIKKEGAAAAGGGPGLFFQQEGRTDASGYYAIQGLDDGTYTLTARKQGYGFKSRTAVVTPATDAVEISFDLARADALAFRAIDAVSGLPLKFLSALVLAGGGDPLAPGGSGATAVFQERRLSADAAGIFHLDSLQPGTYRVVLAGQALATETLHGITVPGPEQTISMAGGGRLEVTATALKRGQTARAVLLDGQRRPVHVNAFFPEPVFLLLPGAPATLEDVRPGSYLVRAAMPGGGIAEKVVEVTQGNLAQVEIP